MQVVWQIRDTKTPLIMFVTICTRQSISQKAIYMSIRCITLTVNLTVVLQISAICNEKCLHLQLNVAWRMYGLKEVALSFSKAPSSVFYHVYHKREGLGAHMNTLMHGQSFHTGPVTSKLAPGSSDPGTSCWHMKYSKVSIHLLSKCTGFGLFLEQTVGVASCG